MTSDIFVLPFCLALDDIQYNRIHARSYLYTAHQFSVCWCTGETSRCSFKLVVWTSVLLLQSQRTDALTASNSSRASCARHTCSAASASSVASSYSFFLPYTTARTKTNLMVILAAIKPHRQAVSCQRLPVSLVKPEPMASRILACIAVALQNFVLVYRSSVQSLKSSDCVAWLLWAEHLLWGVVCRLYFSGCCWFHTFCKCTDYAFCLM